LAAEGGEIDALHPLPDGPWILSRAVLDSTSAKALVHRARKRAKHPSSTKSLLFNGIDRWGDEAGL
jgi:hypothetical protein